MSRDKTIKPWREFEAGEVEAARKLYLAYEGNHNMIVPKMRGMGWSKFICSDLAGKPRRNFAGLIKTYGWRAELEERIRAETDESESDETSTTQSEDVRDEGRAEKLLVDFPVWLAATAKGTWCWDWRFQRPIYRELERITRGKSKRLMIFMPPRHGKSELVTIRYAAWRLSLDAGFRIVVGSYNQRLANRFSRRIRAIYQGEVAEDAAERALVLNTMDEWETAAGGGVKAVGAGAGVTGFGADMIVIDDPIKSRADAESKNNRDRIWEWYSDDLMTRLEPNGSVILIQTRWHEDDLAGRLLSQQIQTSKSKVQSRKGDDWAMIRLPALAEAPSKSDGFSRSSGTSRKRAATQTPKGVTLTRDPIGRREGQALCPERFSRQALLAKKEEMGSYSFAALYQQSPVPAGGGLFKREWFSRIVAAAPAGLRWYRGYDLAVSTKTSADYTASFRVALHVPTGDVYIADGFRGRIEFPDQRKYIVGRIREERDTEHGIEEALHGQAFVQELWREEHLSSSAFRGIRVRGDKLTRALPWANRAEAGKIVLVRGGWVDAFLDEVTHFPNSTHDDQVDAVSLAVQMMDHRPRKVYAF